MQYDCPVAAIRRYRDAEEMRKDFPEPSRHYEQHGVLLLEDAQVQFDEGFIAGTEFPPDWKKIGTANGITVPPLVFRDGQWHRTQNPLVQLVTDKFLLAKLHAELLALELGFKLLVTRLFPPYSRVDWLNCTFRFTRTENEQAHLDAFRGGEAAFDHEKLPRVKFFLNVDSEPRIWNVGPTLPEILKASRGVLGERLPADLNRLCAQLNASGILQRMPMVRVEIPPRGVVFANGATVLHQVLHGRRMVCVEGVVPKESLQPGSTCEWDALEEWIADAGYGVEPAMPREAPDAGARLSAEG